MILLIKYIYNKEKSDKNIGKYQRIIGDVGLFSVGQDFQPFFVLGLTSTQNFMKFLSLMLTRQAYFLQFTGNLLFLCVTFFFYIELNLELFLSHSYLLPHESSLRDKIQGRHLDAVFNCSFPLMYIARESSTQISSYDIWGLGFLTLLNF